MIEHVRFRSIVGVPREFAWEVFLRPGMFERLTPPWQQVETVRVIGSVRPGDVREMQLQFGPVSVRWVAVHEEFDEGRLFSDRQAKGPFKHWRQHHLFRDAGPDRCELVDELDFELPAAGVSHRLGLGIARAELRRMFRYRHFTAFHDLTEIYNSPSSQRRVSVTGEPTDIVRQLRAVLSIGGSLVVDGDSDARVEADVAVRVQQPAVGRALAEIDFERSGQARLRQVESALLLTPDCELAKLARALQFFDLSGELGTAPFDWTTIDDFAFAVRRAIIAGADGAGHIVARHGRQATLRDIAGDDGGPAKRLGQPPEALGALARKAVQRAVLGASPGAGVDHRSRYRSALEALRVQAGQA